MHPPGTRKDPAIAIFLSMMFPGAGYAYVGDVPKFLRTFVMETVVFCLAGNHWVFVMLALAMHVFLAIAAGGAARLWNERQAGSAPPPPPPPRRSAGIPVEALVAAPAAAGDVPPPLPPPPPPPPAARVETGPALEPDAFLAELRAAWGDHRSGGATDDDFAARKRSAIERVRVSDVDDGVALLEATDALVSAGVLTSAERARLKLRVSRP